MTARQTPEKCEPAARRARSLRSLDAYPTRGQPIREQVFAMTTAELFFKALPSSPDMSGLREALRREENVWIEDVIIRANRELVEFHPIENHCSRCDAQLTSCECREYVKLQHSVLLLHVPEAIKRLYFGGNLSIVNRSEQGLLRFSSVRDVDVARYFAPYAPGIGFQTDYRNR